MSSPRPGRCSTTPPNSRTPRLPAGRLIAELVNAPPARALVDRSAGAEMLVLGTSRPPVQPGQPPLAMGPVARICLRQAHCPVVVVGPDDLPGEHDGQPGGKGHAAVCPPPLPAPTGPLCD
jgi:Universal stress protein family